MKNNLWIIISREFKERVIKKSFIITTLLMPLFMLLMMALPAIIMNYSSSSDKTVAVIDNSGKVLEQFIKKSSDELRFVPAKESLDSTLDNEDYYAVLWIPSDIVESPSAAKLYLHDGGSQLTESEISTNIRDAVREERIKKYNIPDLDEIMNYTNVEVNLTTVRVQDSGEEEETSSILSFGLGFAMTFILYMFLLMYGQMVMTSIIEEKNNRVLELVVSSVKPTQLMLGKILGIGLVAVVQILIWAILICSMSAFLMPILMSSMEASSAGAMDPELITMANTLGSVGYIAQLFFYILVFLIGGFLFYASIFAAIGSSVDNVQDASQLVSFATIPIIIGLLFGMAAGNDPNSSLAFWTSVIPFTSPMVMLMRVPFGIPAWEIAVSIAVLYLSFIGMVWVSAKIYRVGIFMYGKKPNIKELIRWARYK